MKILSFGGSDGAEPPDVLAHRSTGAKAAICLIHGFGGDLQKTWGTFPQILLDEKQLAAWDVYSMGYSTGLSFDVVGIWKAAPPLDKLAGLLRTVAAMGDLSGYKSLAFVAHSMGGLIVQRALVEDPELTGRTGHVVLFGTPSGGLKKASVFRGWKRQIRDMGEGSPFITDLRKRWETVFGGGTPFELLAVAGSKDEFVPAESALEPFPEQQRAIVFGNHVEIVKPSGPESLSAQVLVKKLVGEAAPGGPWNSARVAVEMRDFQRAIAELEGHRDELDEKHLVYLALAYEAVGRQEDAVALLEGQEGTDAMGVLAGRHKRMWRAAGRKEDAERALELYQRGYQISVERDNPQQAFYHAINIAYMELEYGENESAAQKYASLALHYATSAPRQDKWSFATQGEAYLLIGKDDIALVRYKQALGQAPTPREMASMFGQAQRIAHRLGRTEFLERLEPMFRSA